MPALAKARVDGQPPSTSPEAIAFTRLDSASAAPPPYSVVISTLSRPPDTSSRFSTKASGPYDWPLLLTRSMVASRQYDRVAPDLSVPGAPEHAAARAIVAAAAAHRPIDLVLMVTFWSSRVWRRVLSSVALASEQGHVNSNSAVAAGQVISAISACPRTFRWFQSLEKFSRRSTYAARAPSSVRQFGTMAHTRACSVS